MDRTNSFKTMLPEAAIGRVIKQTFGNAIVHYHATTAYQVLDVWRKHGAIIIKILMKTAGWVSYLRCIKRQDIGNMLL